MVQGAGAAGAPGAAAAEGGTKVGKESAVPHNEIGAAVEELKAFIKEEKDISSEVPLQFIHPLCLISYILHPYLS